MATYSRISKVYVQVKYEKEQKLQKIYRILQNRDSTQIARLPPPWRKKFQSLGLDSNNVLYLDERLVIPKHMRENILTAIHLGHAGRDAMLRDAADVWWPRIHREFGERANNCPECIRAGKNMNCLKSQKKLGTLPKADKPNEEISLDFAGPFHKTSNTKKYTLVSVDNNSGWPEALFLTNPTTESVLEILAEYIAQHGIPQRIRTDPGRAFKSETFRPFCKASYMKHVFCPIKDHRGNGNVERMIRTINESLRVDNKVVLQRNNRNL